ncbi:asparagine synthase C-terminal domain-containing protein [Halomonas nitroreducens]|uniref:asparagine synthase (glutamine-hydrolyzing) n=1 Tax=Halomonas nitroreducens TaxID=447425 RepID=A0A431UYC7_9GAMM|nr:asparagine synthase C-terminal domain-containing protein [Halomonas nitroreducens]RTQ97318.1 asparagine synthase [Halomonas nitroreducens]
MNQVFRHKGRSSEKIENLCENEGLSVLEIDRSSLEEYLQFGFVHAPNTIYKDVKRIQPEKTDNNCFGKLDVNTDDSVALIKGELTSAIDRGVIEGRTGLLLSSGLDSCAIAACSRHKLNTYTICFDFRDWNEHAIAEKVSMACGHSHQNIIISIDDLKDNFDEWIETLNQPYAHPNSLATYIAFKKIKSNNEVLMDGTGGDTFFGTLGQSAVQEKLIRKRKIVVDTAEFLRKRLGPSRNASAKIFNLIPDTWAKPVSELLLYPHERAIYFNNWKGFFFNYLCERDACLRDNISSLYGSLSAYRDAHYYQYFKAWGAEASSGRVYMASSATGLSVHLPFIDKQLVKLMSQIPDKVLYSGPGSKQILERIVREKHPQYLYSKKAISCPWSLAFKDDAWRSDLYSLSDELTCFPKEKINKIVDQHVKGNMDHAQRLLNLLVLTRWSKIKRVSVF